LFGLVNPRSQFLSDDDLFHDGFNYLPLLIGVEGRPVLVETDGFRGDFLERGQYVAKLIESNRKVGELETKLLKLEGPLGNRDDRGASDTSEA
jgi:hypothetical protein